MYVLLMVGSNGKDLTIQNTQIIYMNINEVVERQAYILDRARMLPFIKKVSTVINFLHIGHIIQ